MNALKESTQRKNSPILLYIRACAEITWKMVNQRPMMEFKTTGLNCEHKPETQVNIQQIYLLWHISAWLGNNAKLD